MFRRVCRFAPTVVLMFRRAPRLILFRQRENCSSRRLFVVAMVFSMARTIFKDSLGRRDRFRPRIVKIGVILAIFEPFQVCCSAKSRPKNQEKSIRHFLANSAKRPRIYIETHCETNFPRDVCLNSSKSGGCDFRENGFVENGFVMTAI